MMKAFWTNSFISFILLSLGSVCSWANVVYVDLNAGGTPNGSSWDDAYLSIQDGINAAGNGDEVWVAQGTYGEALSLFTGISVYGGFFGDESLLDERDHEAYPTVIDATGLSLSAVTMNSVSNARLDGFWVTGGDATTSGGGIYVLSSDNTNAIVDCIIYNNVAGTSGGGIYCESSSPEITRCSIQENTSGSGGAGGLQCYQSSPELTDCVIDGNVTTSNGGGILVQFGASAPTFLRCTFSGNTGFYGGGAYIGNGAQTTFTNCVFSGNVATAFGGAVYVNLTSPEFLNCTIASNTANTYGGGLYLFSAATPELTNTIIYDNSSRAIHENSLDSDATLNHCILNSNPDGDIYDKDSDAIVSDAVNVNALTEASNVLDGSPQFVNDTNGAWDAAASYDGGSDTTTLTDSTAAFGVDDLVGRFINVDTTQRFQVRITSNTATTITVAGDVTGIVTVGTESYAVVDYHLNSGSAGIDAGIFADAPGTDFENDYRDDGLIDIGVDEFIAAGDVWLDFGWAGTASGTLDEPYIDMATALSNVGVGDTIHINGGSLTTNTNWMSTVSSAVRIVTYEGSARIGE